jgi:hypothetical protein
MFLTGPVSNETWFNRGMNFDFIKWAGEWNGVTQAEARYKNNPRMHGNVSGINWQVIACLSGLPPSIRSSLSEAVYWNLA